MLRRSLAALLLFISIFMSAGLASPPVNEDAKQLAVMIRGKFGDTPTFGAGIIFARTADSVYVVTANHVVRRANKGATSLKIQLRRLSSEWQPATLLPNRGKSDLAVLMIMNQGRVVAALNGLRFDQLASDFDLNFIAEADPVFMVGQPNALLWRSSEEPDRITEQQSRSIHFRSAFLAPGYSGGPLFNSNLRLIGLIQEDAAPEGWALRADAVLETLRASKYPIGLSSGIVLPPASPRAVSAAQCEASNPPDAASQRWLAEVRYIIGAYEGCSLVAYGTPGLEGRTIAYGFNLQRSDAAAILRQVGVTDPDAVIRGDVMLTQAQADATLDISIGEVSRVARKTLDPGVFDKLDDVRRYVVVDLIYWLGPGVLQDAPGTRGSLKAAVDAPRDAAKQFYYSAADGILRHFGPDSIFVKYPGLRRRLERDITMLRSGVWCLPTSSGCETRGSGM